MQILQVSQHMPYVNIVTGIHFNNKKDIQKLNYGGKELK